MDDNKPLVAVIGAGPAGLYGAQQLVKQGARVVILNRDIKPGGLAEYGIYFDKYRMKDGLRAQFAKILALPEIEYFGNVTVGKDKDISLEDLKALGVKAILVTVGAQGTKWLGLPGENLRGVYHAKDLVYHYNRLPPYSTREYRIGRRAVIVGVGNVMMDIAHWMVRELKLDTVTAVARRGPAEVKFDKAEFQIVGANVDLDALDAEIERCAPIMRAVGQDPEAAKKAMLAGLERALPPVSSTRLLFDFLASPKAMCGNSEGDLVAVQVEENILVLANGETKAKGTGRLREIPCDTIVFAIGDTVDENFGLPLQRGEFAKNPTPLYPVEGISYEAYDPETKQPIPGIFLAGWARQASTGLVGAARKDGTNGAIAVGEYLKHIEVGQNPDANAVRELLKSKGINFVTKVDIKRLEEAEKAEAKRRGLPEFKFATNSEMLGAIARD